MFLELVSHMYVVLPLAKSGRNFTFGEHNSDEMSENANFYFPPYIPIFLAGIKIGYLLVTLCQGNALIPFWKHRSCAVLGKRSLH